MDLSLRDVFGVSKDVLKSYVTRQVDFDFKDRFELTDHHLVIFGETKVGKTFLRKQYIPITEEVIVVDCTKGINLNDIYIQILYKAGIDLTEKITRTIEESNKLKGEVSSGFLDFLKAKITGELNERDLLSEVRKPYIPNTVSVLVSNELEKANKTTVVLDDFHYLPLIEQYQLSFDLKMFYQNGIRFIILGTKITSGYFEKFNGELSHRIDYFDATTWKTEELREITKKGSEHLNISFSEEVIEFFIKSSNGIVSVFQGLLFEICRTNDVKRTQRRVKEINNLDQAKEIMRNYWENMSVTYFTKIKDIAGGGRRRKLQLYYYITKIVLNSEQGIIRNGFPFQYIFEKLKDIHPLGSSINHGALTTVLSHLDELQIEKEIFPKVFTYFDKRLSIVDSDFYFITKHLDRNKIDEILPPHEYVINIEEQEEELQLKLFD
ncbi:Keratin, type I cytoskeletal 18 [Paenibacillus stellifer]|uniref:Keratin, type I cytoskeletal 18 n=1 Tax=Paenibacillus stellifer TaxID=169760 RepID=A0A089LZ16_9BACL|nr:Keratin, type I cytoskeletal 18 [Paenibacillus stellifer]AIQ66162.1 Keratin, type I cytoskeletal 18 [Paenibacillus stellifer]